jgi:hypothetical protein
MNDLTLMLQNSDGDEKLLAEKVLPLVYEELRRLAADAHGKTGRISIGPRPLPCGAS